MARRRLHDFRQEDSTRLFNERFWGMLKRGVYAGYTVGTGGSGGLYLKFTHDAHPTDSGAYLGTLLTPDGVIIQEDTNVQDDVVLGSVSAGTPNIHYVVASYQYNAALPNNDVSYAVRQGTSGSPPLPPILGEDEVLLAEIFLPSGATTYTDAGVDIKTIAKEDLYGVPTVLKDQLEDMLDPGIYDGMEMSEGSTVQDVDLAAGTWLTQESVRIVESSVQSDVITLTTLSANQHRYAWLAGMHKSESLDPVPGVDYVIVEGTAVGLTTQAVPPDNSAILTAAQAVDAKYDDNSYINKIGLIHIEDRGGIITVRYHKGETVLDKDSLVVYAATAKSQQRSGQYYGIQGLRDALSAAHAAVTVVDDFAEARPVTVFLDGELESDSAKVLIPSGVKLKGLGNAKIVSDLTTSVIEIEGFNAEYDSANDTIVQGSGSGSLSGYVPRTFAIQATYQVGDNLVTKKLLPGDRVLLSDGATTYEGILREVISAWAFNAWVETAYNSDGNPEVVDITIYKSRSGVEDVEIASSGSGNGLLTVQYTEHVELDDVKCEDIVLDYSNHSKVGYLEVSGNSITWMEGSATLHGGQKYLHNRFKDVLLSGALTGTVSLGSREQYSRYGRLAYVGSSNPSIAIDQDNVDFGEITLVGTAGTDLQIEGESVTIGQVSNTSPTGSSDVDTGVLSNGLFIGTVETTDQFQMNGGHCIVGHLKASTVDVVDHLHMISSNVILASTGVSSFDADWLSYPHMDKNTKIASDASLSWDLSTQSLSWDDHIYFLAPWTNSSYNRVNSSSSPQTLNDGDMLIVTLDRDVSGTVNVPLISVLATASRTTISKSANIFVLAHRYNNDIYLWDGTRIEDGQSIKIGQTPPPDGSVTYVKFATDAVAFHNKFFRDYVVVEDNTGWEDDIVFRNTLSDSLTYTSATGVLSGYTASQADMIAAEDLLDSGVPLTVILNNTVDSCYRVLDIDASAGTVTIADGLLITTGAADNWNGALAKGAQLVTNDDLETVNYDSTSGRITWGATVNMEFNDNQVFDGCVFTDDSGREFRIHVVDASGTFVDIAKGLRPGIDITTGTPTTKFGGSIKKNNNPFNLALADLRTVVGTEFIPIDGYGSRLSDNAESLMRDEVGTDDEYANYARFSISPYDPRVSIQRDAHNALADSTPGSTQYYPRSGDTIVQVTAVCTGAFLILGGFDDDDNNVQIWVDGKSPSSGIKTTDAIMDPLGSAEHAHYSAIGFPGIYGTRNTVGVHHFEFHVTGLNMPVRGVLLVNDGGGFNSDPVVDSPGQAVLSGGVFSKSAPGVGASFPDLSGSGWNKGGRIVRQASVSGGAVTYSWATSTVPNHTGTGTAASTDTLTSVTNASSFRKNDIMMLFPSASSTFELRRILSISGSTIVLDSATSYSGTVNTYYYGKCIGANDHIGHTRVLEEPIQDIPILDFLAPGQIDGASSSPGVGLLTAGTSVASVLSDGVTSLSVLANNWFWDSSSLAEFKTTTASASVRLVFVGTGLSIRGRFSANGCDVSIDGVDAGALDTTTPSIDTGGMFVCGELPYGVHVVDFTNDSGGGTFGITGFTVWGPKKPASIGMELWETFLVSASESDLGFNATTDTDRYSLGNVPLAASNYGKFSLIGDGTVQPSKVAAANSPRLLTCVWTPALSSNDYVEFTFFGKAFTVVQGAAVWSSSSGGQNILISGSSGSFQAPSAVTGVTVTESAGDSFSSGSPFTFRSRYVFDSVGIHTIRIEDDGVGGSANAYAISDIEIESPIHRHQTKLPKTLDLWMPHPFGGVDLRPQSPFDHSRLSSLAPHCQGFDVFDDLNPDEQFLFAFYSHGGSTEVSVTAEIEDTDATGGHENWFIEIDGGGAVSPAVLPNQAVADTEEHTVTITAVFELTQGFHFATLQSSAEVDANFINVASWSAKSFPSPQSGLPGLGLNRAAGGMGSRNSF